MKATFDLPDDLYRRAKARSALEGRPLRAVTMELFQRWLEQPSGPAVRVDKPASSDTTRFDGGAWTTLIRPHLRPDMEHTWPAVKDAIADGWGRDAAATAELPAKLPERS